MQIKPKIDKRGWELDRLEEMKLYITKIMKNKRNSKKKSCQTILREITNLLNEL